MKCWPSIFFPLLLFSLLLIKGPDLYARNKIAITFHALFTSLPARPFDTLRIHKLVQHGDELVWTNPDSAIAFFSQAQKTSLIAGYPDGIITSMLNLGHAYASRGAYMQGFATYRLAGLYSFFSVDRTALARVYTDIATTYLMQSSYPDAAMYYYKAFKTQKDNGMSDKPAILFTYANLAYLQSKFGRYELAIDYLSQAEAIARRKHYYGPLGFILNNKGEAYASLGKPHEAYRCYIEGLEQCRKGTYISRHQSTEIEQSILISLGSLMLEQYKPQRAIDYLLKAMRLSNSTSPYYTDIFPKYQLGLAYYTLKDYPRAEHMLNEALAKARQIKFNEDMPEALLTLSKVYEAEGAYSQALAQYKAYSLMRDSLMNLEKIKLVRLLETRYHTAQKDKELAEKKFLITKQNNQLMKKNTLLLIFSLSALLLFAVSLLMLLRYRSIQHTRRLQTERLQTISKEMELVEQEKRMLKKEEKLKIFQALVKGEEKERQRLARELHDGIGGMLAAIQMQFSTLKFVDDDERGRRIDKIMQMLGNMSVEIRETAHNLMPDIVLKHQLQDALQLFCSGISESGILSINLQMHNVSLVLDKSTELCIYRIVQELVQNIIKHSAASEAVIQLTQQEKMLYVFAEDNGIGFDNRSHKGGLGLQNLHSRVQSLQGTLSIDSAPGKGTTCYIELDLSTTTLQAI